MKKIIGLIVCTLLILTIIPISLAAETQSKCDAIDFIDSKIYIRTRFSPGTHMTYHGFPSAILMFTSIYRNVDIEIKLYSEDVYTTSIVYINGKKQIFQEPVTIIIEGFNGLGNPVYIYAFLQKIILLGTGNIIMNN